MKKAILIGASGFLGQHMLWALKKAGYQVHAVVHRNDPGEQADHLIRGGIKALDHALVDRIRPELIIHCARPSYPQFRRIGRMLSARYAARANSKLLAQLKKSSCKPLMAFSSGSLVYGNSQDPHPEKISVNPISYARQYYKGEQAFTRAVENNSYPLLLFRLPWLLGAGSWFKWFYLNPITEKKCIPLFNSGENIMEIIDVKDAVRQMLYFCSLGKAGIINLPGSIRSTQLEFASKVSSVFEIPQKPYTEVFTGKLEAEVLEAFTSNILLSSKYSVKIKEFDYCSLEESLQLIKGIIR